MLKVSVIGLGAWGSALGLTAHRAGARVTMVGLEHNVEAVLKDRSVPLCPKVVFPKEMEITADLAVLAQSDLIVFVVPAQGLRACVEGVKDVLPKGIPLIIATKGIEQKTNLFVGELVSSLVDNPCCILSGPNFAKEIIQNLPACTVVAAKDEAVGVQVRDAFCHVHFRPYLSTDVMGVQVVGAVKNVLAIGCGIIKARGLGENALAAFVSRGLAEIKDLGVAKGGQLSTFLGLAGVGDVMLTCMSAESRNFQLGLSLGKENKVNKTLVANQTVEGFHTVKALKALSEKMGMDMPVCETIHRILYEGESVDTAIEVLLSRPLK